MKKIILIMIMIIFILILINGCKILELKPHLEIETETCYIQDNNNWSHQCEYSCTDDVRTMIIFAEKCANSEIN